MYNLVIDRLGDTRAKLLHGEEWEAKRLQACRSLGHSSQSDESLQGLAKQLDATYRQAADHFEKNDSVRVEYQNDKPTPTITNLDKLDEPPSLITLREKVTALLPRIDLAELLLEVHAHWLCR